MPEPSHPSGLPAFAPNLLPLRTANSFFTFYLVIVAKYLAGPVEYTREIYSIPAARDFIYIEHQRLPRNAVDSIFLVAVSFHKNHLCLTSTPFLLVRKARRVAAVLDSSNIGVVNK